MLQKSEEVAIVINNVSKTYKLYDNPKDRLKEVFSFNGKKYYKEFHALKDISFEINKGDIIGLVGKNGSGKSTLLKIITGVLSPSSGNVTVNGKIAALLELGAGFNPEFTGMENIFLQGTIMGYTHSDMEKKLNDILEFAEIGEFIHQPVKTYSSGMFVRLAFAVATQTLPDILIVDEALAVGDEKFQRKCYSYLKKLQDRGTTILFVSHSMSTVEQLCNKGVLLESGEMIFSGTPKEVIDLYHDRIYALDAEELKQLNKKAVAEQEGSLSDVIHQEHVDLLSDKNREVQISNIEILKGETEEFLFNTGDNSKVVVTIKNNTDRIIENTIVGFKIRTKQGVEVYGTSTYYYDDLELILGPHEEKKVMFEQNLNLMAGYYYLTYAVAKRNLSDMGYYDKLIDYTVIQIEDKKIKGSGISNLFSKLTIGEK